MEKKMKKLDGYIEEISNRIDVPFWMVKIEVADEAGVGNAYELSEADIDAMISLCEKECA